MSTERDDQGTPLTRTETAAAEAAAKGAAREINLDKAYTALKESCSNYYVEVWQKAFGTDMGKAIQGTSRVANKEKKFQALIAQKAERYKMFFGKLDSETPEEFDKKCHDFAKGEIRELYEATGRTSVIEAKWYDKVIDAVTKKIAQGFTKVRNFFKKAKIVLKETFTRENRGEVIKNLFKTGWQAMKTAFQTVRTAVGVEVDRLVEKAKFSHIATDFIRDIGGQMSLAGMSYADKTAKATANRSLEEATMRDRAVAQNQARSERIANEDRLRAERGIRSREQAGKSNKSKGMER